MFSQLQLLKAITATGCPRPLSHLKAVRRFNAAYPQFWIGLYCGACLPVERGSNKLVTAK